jgi:rod shape-determining protein MreC
MRRIVVVSLASIVSLGLITYWWFPSALDVASSYALYPFLRAQKIVIQPINNFFERKRRMRDLEQKMVTLEKKYETLLQENIILRSSDDYSSDIEELVKFKSRYRSSEKKAVQVLVKHFSNDHHFFLVDAGSNQGISSDMVAVYKNCLVGKVVDVYPCYSKVLLVSDISCKVAAYCSKTRATGIHQGCNNKQRSMLNRVSHFAKIKSSDIVLSSGYGLVFPRGFALGKVKSYNLNGLFYDIDIQPVIELDTIEYCYLIKKGSEL